jgi:hypothetical protein
MGFGAAVKKELLKQFDPGLRGYKGTYHQIRLMSNKITRCFYLCKWNVIFMTDFSGGKLHNWKMEALGVGR